MEHLKILGIVICTVGLIFSVWSITDDLKKQREIERKYQEFLKECEEHFRKREEQRRRNNWKR